MDKYKKRTQSRNERIDRRRDYIKTRVENRNTTITAEVRRIARDLFMSERTVYDDIYAGER